MVNNTNTKINLRKYVNENDTWKITNNIHPSPYLPDYKSVCHPPVRPIYNRDGTTFTGLINKACDKAMLWRKNRFKVPSGNAGKDFIKLQTEWLRKYNDNLVFKGIALTVDMILLQKPSPALKSKVALK